MIYHCKRKECFLRTDIPEIYLLKGHSTLALCRDDTSNNLYFHVKSFIYILKSSSIHSHCFGYHTRVLSELIYFKLSSF